ncbi:Gfo/Idh/MocA family protein, partial [Rhizobium johnstonii]|uniref:Gfo/Idh/MocA family protein n=1 Tax=Rhizobium johnstonii TaxID=3019933 RepID=UPI003F944739
MIKFAIGGCGRIAKRHSELLGLSQIKGATLAAVCDIAEERAREFGERFGVHYYRSIDEMLQNTEVDVVSILT